ncbi:hypothetical protein RB195_008959 [Necator americanus]|uniref:Uncharacterized protein n=1 Tax=Necator americanus TaxID=51031 RepID=A0ABR1CRX8_NECAM
MYSPLTSQHLMKDVLRFLIISLLTSTVTMSEDDYDPKSCGLPTDEYMPPTVMSYGTTSQSRGRHWCLESNLGSRRLALNKAAM